MLDPKPMPTNCYLRIISRKVPFRRTRNFLSKYFGEVRGDVDYEGMDDLYRRRKELIKTYGLDESEVVIDEEFIRRGL